MYKHESKCKNDKIKERKKERNKERFKKTQGDFMDRQPYWIAIFM
jgi:hypothetical protein